MSAVELSALIIKLDVTQLNTKAMTWLPKIIHGPFYEQFHSLYQTTPANRVTMHKWESEWLQWSQIQFLIIRSTTGTPLVLICSIVERRADISTVDVKQKLKHSVRMESSTGKRENIFLDFGEELSL